MIKLSRANIYVSDIKVKGLILNIDHTIIPIVKDSSNIPLINRASSIPDLTSSYLNNLNQLLLLPAIPIVHETGFRLLLPKVSFSNISSIDTLSNTNGKFIVDVINLTLHGSKIPKRITTEKNSCSDSAGKKYHCKEFFIPANNLIDASAGIMVKCNPLPLHLLPQALEYCSLLLSKGELAEGFIYTSEGLEMYA